MQTFAQSHQNQKPASSGLARSHLVKRGLDFREHPVQHLQPALGNQPVQRMVETRAEECTPGTTTLSMRGFGHDFGRIPIHPLAAGVIQTKLLVNEPGDKYEQEADAVSKEVMRMPESQLQRKCACGGTPGPDGECENCRKKRLELQRKTQHFETGNRGVFSAPPIVHEVLRSTGQPLEPAMRSSMSQKFGADFSKVRVHTDSRAAESAFAVNALAYTVGQNVVFGKDQYRPDTLNGQRLLAHELTHVVQQNQASFSSLQRACRSAAQCAVPSAGDAAVFGDTVEAESEAIAVASGGVAPVAGGPTSCTLPRHGQRATNFEALATGAGLGAAIAPGIAGFFINACLSPNDGANNAPCSDFPGGPPAGANPALACVQLHTTDEDQAIALLAKPKPLGDADLRKFLEITASVAHESQHSRFNAHPGTVVPPAADCNVNTPVPIARGRKVESLLSEISAEIAEFDVYFRNAKSNPSRSSTLAVQSEEHTVASRPGPPGHPTENILGNIKDLQCACACNTVAKFVEQVFNDASSSWTPEEKKEFKKAMTDFIPSFWPASLHQK